MSIVSMNLIHLLRFRLSRWTQDGTSSRVLLKEIETGYRGDDPQQWALANYAFASAWFELGIAVLLFEVALLPLNGSVIKSWPPEWATKIWPIALVSVAMTLVYNVLGWAADASPRRRWVRACVSPRAPWDVVAVLGIIGWSVII